LLGLGLVQGSTAPGHYVAHVARPEPSWTSPGRVLARATFARLLARCCHPRRATGARTRCCCRKLMPAAPHHGYQRKKPVSGCHSNVLNLHAQVLSPLPKTFRGTLADPIGAPACLRNLRLFSPTTLVLPSTLLPAQLRRHSRSTRLDGRSVASLMYCHQL
jgi:hypothetical protein